MASFLSPIRTSHPQESQDDPLLTVSNAAVHHTQPTAIPLPSPASLTTQDDALAALRSSPSPEVAVKVLHLLVDKFGGTQTPSSKSSLLVHTLLESTLPDLWDALSKKDRQLLVRCMRSATGLGGMVARLRTLLSLAKGREGAVADAVRKSIEDVLVLLQCTMSGNQFIYESLLAYPSDNKGLLMWKEFVSLVAGGKIVSIAAEAEGVLGGLSRGRSERWVGNGRLFANRLAWRMAEVLLTMDIQVNRDLKRLALLLTRSFGLGYTDELVESFTCSIARNNEEGKVPILRLRKIISHMAVHEKRTYLLSLFRVVSSKHFQQIPAADVHSTSWWKADSIAVAGAAALLDSLISHDDDVRDITSEWLASSSGGGVGEPIALRRSILAVLSMDPFSFKALFEKSLDQFADKLWIRHTPILRQEGHAHRNVPSLLSRLTRSSAFLNGVSNRLAASSTRARFLGMIVGEAFSAFSETKMTFDNEETTTPEAKWWKSIPYVEDHVGSISDLFIEERVPQKRKPANPLPPIKATDTKIQIVNSEPSDEEDDDEFVPYAMPDSDAEDSDEDPTTVNRNKPSAPVYIRDLIRYLRTTDSYDHQHLALTHANALIRRKAGFGTELSAHLEELAALLAGLSDKFDVDDFENLRLQALVSLVVADPVPVGRYLVRQFFMGDYGLSQRVTLLAAIGIGARELAGFADDSHTPFPSKKLPEKLDAIWSSSAGNKGGTGKSRMISPVDSLTTDLQRTYITPLAASAADKASGPDILKVRTFSSRMAVAARTPKPTSRRILSVVTDAFFFPLTGGWFVASRSGAAGNLHPYIVSTFVKTLALVFHAAGPASSALSQMTAELWELVLAVGRGSEDVSVHEACLFAMLTLLEVNIQSDGGKRRLVEEYGRVLLETQEWVEAVFEHADEDNRVLAASVLVRVSEVREEYQVLLMGTDLSME